MQAAHRLVAATARACRGADRHQRPVREERLVRPLQQCVRLVRKARWRCPASPIDDWIALRTSSAVASPSGSDAGARFGLETVGERLRLRDAARQDERLSLHREEAGAAVGGRGVCGSEERRDLDQRALADAPGRYASISARAPRRSRLSAAAAAGTGSSEASRTLRRRGPQRASGRRTTADACRAARSIAGGRLEADPAASASAVLPQYGRREASDGSSGQLVATESDHTISKRPCPQNSGAGKQKGARGRLFDCDRAIRGVSASALMACARRDFVRDAEFLWTIFLSAMRSITACDAWNSLSASALSPAAIALRTFLTAVRSAERRLGVAVVRHLGLAGALAGLGTVGHGSESLYLERKEKRPSIIAAYRDPRNNGPPLRSDAGRLQSPAPYAVPRCRSSAHRCRRRSDRPGTAA